MIKLGALEEVQTDENDATLRTCTLTYTAGTTLGSDSFTFRVNDGTTDSNEATININVYDSPDITQSQTIYLIKGKDIREPHRNTAKTFMKIMKKNKKVRIKKFQE